MYLYRTVERYLNWTERWDRIFDEISKLRPDVLCLQEVDQFEYIQTSLNRLGLPSLRSDGLRFWIADILEAI